MNKIDAPIMILFFNRPDVLKDLFEWVRSVKPKQLFLVQDGAREENEADMEKILACREIVENVDWDCDVKKNYSSANLTCDHREYTGIDWCFEYVDRLIVLEDDCLPSKSFYPFCAELLEKYKEDERIHMICGFNRCNSYTSTPYDYVFSTAAAGIGWATWKRVWDNVKSLKENSFFESEESSKYYRNLMQIDNSNRKNNIISVIENTKHLNEQNGRVNSWEKLVGGVAVFQSAFSITPSKNLIKYNGITEDATHCYSNERLLSKKIRKVLTQTAYEIDFPLKHPRYVVRDRLFETEDGKTMTQNRFLHKLELVFNAIRVGRYDIILGKIKKKICRRK